MSIARFAAYAAAFEKSFESDDWSLVESHLSKDVVYDNQLNTIKSVFTATLSRYSCRQWACLQALYI